MNTCEARIHALNARSRALAAEFDAMRIRDLNEIANDRGLYTEATYAVLVNQLYQVEQDIYAVIREGWL